MLAKNSISTVCHTVYLSRVTVCCITVTMYFLDGDAVETDQAPTYTNIAMYKSYL